MRNAKETRMKALGGQDKRDVLHGPCMDRTLCVCENDSIIASI